MVAESTPDLVVLDLQIGNMGGIAACLHLRHEAGAGRLPDVPVLMLLDRQADVFLAKRSGADGWVVKPLDAFTPAPGRHRDPRGRAATATVEQRARRRRQPGVARPHDEPSLSRWRRVRARFTCCRLPRRAAAVDTAVLRERGWA